MKSTLAPQRLSINESGARSDFHGRPVEFLLDRDGRLMLLTGEFVVRDGCAPAKVEIVFTGRLEPTDRPGSQYLFHPSLTHLRSTEVCRRPGPLAFIMETPLRVCDCEKLTAGAPQVAAEPVFE